MGKAGNARFFQVPGRQTDRAAGTAGLEYAVRVHIRPGRESPQPPTLLKIVASFEEAGTAIIEDTFEASRNLMRRLLQGTGRFPSRKT